MDMQWLSQNGYPVVGVECSAVAVKEFVKDYGVSIEGTESDKHIKYTINDEVPDSANIELIQGDFFELTVADLEDVTDVFDRASLIALPEAMRKSYAEKMMELLNPGVRTLLITLTYPQHEMDGPPFSVSEEDALALEANKQLVRDLEVALSGAASQSEIAFLNDPVLQFRSSIDVIKGDIEITHASF